MQNELLDRSFHVKHDLTGGVTDRVGKASGDPRLLPGVFAWQSRRDDLLRVRLVFAPRDRIEVDLYWNRAGGRPDVQLIFALYPDFVEFGSLTGNGFDSPAMHRRGFGTLAVNTAIQALHRACDPETPVAGILSNTDEEGLDRARRLGLEEGRRAFWRRFGLQVVTAGSPAQDFLRGRVRDLHPVADEPTASIAGQFPRCIPLDDFTCLSTRCAAA